MSEKWTPGPWKAVPRHADMGPHDDEMSGLGWEVEGPPEPMLRGQFSKAADAHLIAAAPLMAEALEAWADWWNALHLDRQVDNHEAAHAAITATRRALSAARGER